MWGESKKMKVTETDRVEGDVAGIKSASLRFEGEYPFGNLKSEIGVHRLVRLSPFDSAKKKAHFFCLSICFSSFG